MVRYIPRTSVNIVVAAVFRFPDKKLWSASVIVTAELKRIAVFNTVTTKCLQFYYTDSSVILKY